MLKLKKSCFALGIDVVRYRRTSESDRLIENIFEELVQFLELIARDGGSAPLWTNACAKK